MLPPPQIAATVIDRNGRQMNLSDVTTTLIDLEVGGVHLKVPIQRLTQIDVLGADTIQFAFTFGRTLTGSTDSQINGQSDLGEYRVSISDVRQVVLHVRGITPRREWERPAGYVAQIGDFTVYGVKAVRHEGCGGLFYYMGSARETTVPTEHLDVDNGSYAIRVPFAIVRRIALTRTRGYADVEATLVLSDSTTVEGLLRHTDRLSGTTEFGDITVAVLGPRHLKETTVIFTEEPRPRFTATSPAHTPATVVFKDGSQLPLERVAFRNESQNQNGCYTGEEFLMSLKFKIEGSGAELDVPIDRISRLDSLGHRGDGKFPIMRLVSKTGSDFTGQSVGCKEIVGLFRKGAYTVLALVNLGDSHVAAVQF